jgi:hypothetical protein
MERIPICIRINGNDSNPHPPRCRNNAAGNLAAVRNKDFFKHLDPVKARPGAASITKNETRG